MYRYLEGCVNVPHYQALTQSLNTLNRRIRGKFKWAWFCMMLSALRHSRRWKNARPSPLRVLIPNLSSYSTLSSFRVGWLSMINDVILAWKLGANILKAESVILVLPLYKASALAIREKKSTKEPFTGVSCRHFWLSFFASFPEPPMRIPHSHKEHSCKWQHQPAATSHAIMRLTHTQSYWYEQGSPATATFSI